MDDTSVEQFLNLRSLTIDERRQLCQSYRIWSVPQACWHSFRRARPRRVLIPSPSRKPVTQCASSSHNCRHQRFLRGSTLDRDQPADASDMVALSTSRPTIRVCRATSTDNHRPGTATATRRRCHRRADPLTPPRSITRHRITPEPTCISNLAYARYDRRPSSVPASRGHAAGGSPEAHMPSQTSPQPPRPA
jgi:hypothetical protein